MSWFQTEIQIDSKPRGFNLVTNEVLSKVEEIKEYRVGVIHLFIKHTSASLTINENADSTVRDDLESHFNVMVPENQSYYKHTFEGSDDMPAHIKSSLLGSSLSIPIKDGNLNLGMWQGVYLCEHRNTPHNRKIVITINGDK